MVNRLTLTLEQPEYSGLLQMAGNELRSPHEQVRWIVRRELERAGLLQPIRLTETEARNEPIR